MKQIITEALRAIATVTIIALSTIGLAFLIYSLIIQRQPFMISFTQDYINAKYYATDIKISAYKDSVIKYRAMGKDSIANKYTDSANLYINIQNYIK